MDERRSCATVAERMVKKKFEMKEVKMDVQILKRCTGMIENERKKVIPTLLEEISIK